MRFFRGICQKKMDAIRLCSCRFHMKKYRAVLLFFAFFAFWAGFPVEGFAIQAHGGEEGVWSTSLTTFSFLSAWWSLFTG